MTSALDRASPPPSAARSRRRRPGAACEECRRRKLRCDGQRPQCSVCLGSGVVCEISAQRAVRGPKKGYLKALRNRIVMLESRLEGQLQQQPPLSASCGPETRERLSATPTDCSDDGADPSNAARLLGSSLESSVSNSPTSMCITELMRAELDQLYFDRVHASIPILHQRRYLSWSKTKANRISRTCLQYAIWTLAALLSAQFQDLQAPLYHETKQMLESLSHGTDGNSPVDTQQVQAWILIATYESARTLHWQAWSSAGRAFRLVQLMRLHEIDSPAGSSAADCDFVEVEERRRAFWLAYFLDHLFSMRNDWPVTLNEHVICTRLPAPEAEFQRGQPVLGAFLSEAIIKPKPHTRSPFNECVILATICGRSLFHGQQYNIRRAYGDAAPDWTDQHRWLDDILTTRLQILSQHYPSPTDSYDPMLLFANIMAQATVIYLCKGMQSAAWPADRGTDAAMEYQQRALDAAEKLVDLARALTEFHFFKVHPLMPIPLFISAEFLYTSGSSHEQFGRTLQDLLAIFRQLINVNDSSQSYIDLLGFSCVSTSSTLAKEAKQTRQPAAR